MKVREAKKPDLKFILRGVCENAKLSFPHFKKNQTTESVYRKRIFHALRDRKQKILIANMNKKPCGFLWLRLEETEISLERFGYMQSIWVYRKFRRLGIAALLLEAATWFLRDRKYRKMRATYTVSNLSIENFLRKNGFRIRRILVEKRI